MAEGNGPHDGATVHRQRRTIRRTATLPLTGMLCELFPANKLCLNYQSMPINQLNHIYTANISQPKSSSTFTRECS